MEPKSLLSHISELVQKNISSTEIREQMTAIGWSEDEINGAYAEALIAGGAPTPADKVSGSYSKKPSTVEVILNFFSFILLGVVAFALGTIYFAIINDFFADALDRGSYYYSSVSDSIHYSIAALIIGFPIYFVSLKLWFKKFRLDDTKKESKLTKWVTYLVLLAAAITIVGDLISILYTFLQGEISVRFFLKSLTVLVIAGMIFGFYYLERKKVQYKSDIPRSTFKIFGYVLTIMVLVGIVLGFVVAGSPATERMRTFDERRASDLSSIADCVSRYANEYQALPKDISALQTSSLSYCTNKKDPETNEPYEYNVTSNLHGSSSRLIGEFELCATFSLDSRNNTGYRNDPKWYSHGAGKDCDSQSVSVIMNR